MTKSLLESVPGQPLETSTNEESLNEHSRPLSKKGEVRPRHYVATFSRRWCGLPYTALCCLFLYFFVEMYDMITIAPLTAIFEQSLCRKWYINHDPSRINFGGPVNEQFCKLEPIQAAVAVLRGWKLAFDTVPGTNLLRLQTSTSCNSNQSVTDVV